MDKMGELLCGLWRTLNRMPRSRENKNSRMLDFTQVEISPFLEKDALRFG